MAARPVSRCVSAYNASTSATMRPRRAGKSWASGSLMASSRKASAITRRSSRLLVSLDQRVGAVVVDRLDVLRLDHVGLNALIQIEHRGDIAHQVLDALGIVVGALGDEFFVGALEQPVELAG